MASNKVLIVDNESETRTQIREMLPGGKFEILEAIDGEEALLLFDSEAKTLRLVIVNFELPAIGGWDVLKKLQNDRALQKIPVVLMCDHLDTVQQQVPPAYFQYVEVLGKPFERKQLQQAIKSAVGKAKLPRQPLPLELLSTAEPAPSPEPVLDLGEEPSELPEIAPEEIPAAVSDTPAETGEVQEEPAGSAAIATEDTAELAMQPEEGAEFAVLPTPYDAFECWYAIGDRAAWGINCLAIYFDGESLVGSSESDAIKLWNLRSGTLAVQWSLYSKGIHCFALSPSEPVLISGAAQTNVKFWDITTGELLGPLNDYSSGVSAIAITPDGQTIVTAADRSNIKLWSRQTGELLGPLNDHSLGATALAIAPDGQTLLSGFATTNIKLWDILTGELLGPLNIHSSGVTALAASPDGQLAISGHIDGSIAFCNLSNGQILRRLKAHSQAVSALALSPDGQLLVSASSSEIKVWSAIAQTIK